LVEGIRLGDFTLRGKLRKSDDAFSELVNEINCLADELSRHRIANEEALKLLEKTIAHINVAIFAFDSEQKIKLANQAACRLLSMPYEQIIGSSAEVQDLAQFLGTKKTRLINHTFPGAIGRWQVRSEGFRDAGVQQHVLFITDLRQVLRDEELTAWKNLMRVVSHEINNSLFPITSLSQTLTDMIHRDPLAEDWKDDLNEGLTIISERSNSLNGFIKRYAQLAKVPVPDKKLFKFEVLIERVMTLFERDNIEVDDALLNLPMLLYADPSMIEQVIINLTKNAFEAGGPIKYQWSMSAHHFTFQVLDSGKGISNVSNIFVPFYTTKPQGSGIGLVFCRQILDSHDGSLSLNNITDNKSHFNGCVAIFTLPVYTKEPRH
jgi:nitrogen fixation/metabolism regulation signal transduction histidine kinase